MRCCPVIAGTTAVGKTGLVVALAAEFPIEVISLDSRQIYRGLRIGTAQPDAAEIAACPHHLVDFVDPREKYSAARFRRDFEKVWREIVSRDRVPILVGGAGMYLTSLREGLFTLPDGADERLPKVRAGLDTLDDDEVRRRLAAVDRKSAARIHVNDRYRTQRALEIHALCGRTMSELMAERRPDPSLGLDFPVFLLRRDTDELDHRITRRTEAMLGGGWLAETRELLAEYPADCPGLLSIGYREIVAHLAGDLDRDAMRERIVTVTRQYARRQRTWFRNVETRAAGEPENEELRSALRATIAECRA